MQQQGTVFRRTLLPLTRSPSWFLLLFLQPMLIPVTIPLPLQLPW